MPIEISIEQKSFDELLERYITIGAIGYTIISIIQLILEPSLSLVPLVSIGFKFCLGTVLFSVFASCLHWILFPILLWILEKIAPNCKISEEEYQALQKEKENAKKREKTK